MKLNMEVSHFQPDSGCNNIWKLINISYGVPREGWIGSYFFLAQIIIFKISL